MSVGSVCRLASVSVRPLVSGRVARARSYRVRATLDVRPVGGVVCLSSKSIGVATWGAVG